MPLVPSILSTKLSNFIDGNSPLFIKSPSNSAEAALYWSDAIGTYCSMVGPPSPGLILSSKTAKAYLYSNILAAINSNTFDKLISNIIYVYVGTLSTGFAPTYIPVPPIVPPMLLPIFELKSPSAVFIRSFTTIVDTWMRTGVSIIPSSPPTPIPWF